MKFAISLLDQKLQIARTQFSENIEILNNLKQQIINIEYDQKVVQNKINELETAISRLTNA